MEEDKEVNYDELSNDDRINFRVYDMPLPLVQEYIQMAKLHYQNDVWRVLADAMDLLKREQQGRGRAELADRVHELEARVTMLQAQIEGNERQPKEKENEGPKTFGGGSSTDDDDMNAETIEKLQSFKEQ